jgi:hypothetical protein
MTTKQKIRQVFRYLQSQETGYDKHGNNGYVVLSGKKFFVGEMSYFDNEYYIEPYRRNRTERDKFHEDTLWENSDAADIIDLFIKNNLWDKKL